MNVNLTKMNIIGYGRFVKLDSGFVAQTGTDTRENFPRLTPSHGAVHDLWTILQGLRQMCGLNLFATSQIRNCAR